MNAKIYKAIFRLDYPISYRIFDHLGEYLEFISNKTDQPPFFESKGVLNIVSHSIVNNCKIGNDVFTLNLSIKDFDAVIEFQDGIDIKKLPKCPLFSLADEIIEKLEEGNRSKYDRVGFRVFLIAENSKLTFNGLRDRIWDCNSTFGDALLKDRYTEKEDIALVYEASSKNDEKIRYQCGPYQEKEVTKYFSLKNNIKEGFIADIDIWQSKVTLPKLKLVSFINEYQKIYDKIIKNTYEQLG
jgi:hypothetical protein